VTKTTKKTAALYARFSSDLQEDRSIEDQFDVCRKLASREGIKVIATFNDRAKSGATLFDRDGLLDLMTAAKAHSFNVVIVENLDRLSRGLADLPSLFERLTHYGVEIITVNEGVTTKMHVGIRGIISSMFLTDLAHKVRRGLDGRVREGKFPGAVTYGYRLVPGKPGEREIDPVEAAIVVRVFTEYAQGRSPRAIAADLTREAVPTPSGGAAWNYTSFLGSANRYGILQNRLYIGEIVWNKNHNVLDPDTGRKLKRANPKAQCLHVEAPQLRIIDQSLWDAVQSVRTNRSVALFDASGKAKRRVPITHRSEHVLAGILRCATCGGNMRINSRTAAGSRVACATAYRTNTCDHRHSYDLGQLTAGVVSGMREHLTDPAALVVAARAFHTEWATRSKRANTDANSIKRQLNRVQVKIDRLVAAIRDSDDSLPELQAQIKPLSAERAGLAERLRLVEAGSNVVSLHPKVIDAYRLNVEKLHDALLNDTLSQETRTAFHNLIDCIVVHPTEKRAPYEFTPYARLGAIMGINLFPAARSPRELLADEGLSNYDTVGPAPSGP
jgi:site-specific DNA recombinase